MATLEEIAVSLKWFAAQAEAFADMSSDANFLAQPVENIRPNDRSFSADPGLTSMLDTYRNLVKVTINMYGIGADSMARTSEGLHDSERAYAQTEARNSNLVEEVARLLEQY